MSATSMVHTETHTAKHPWRIVAAYAFVASASQMLWLTFAPITTATAHHLHVSESAVGWLSEVFPLLYVLLAIPASMALDRWFRSSLIAGATLTAAGGLVRLGGDTFTWALAGQLLIACGQPLVLNAITKLSSEYLPAEKRPEAISYGSAGIFGGMLLGLGLGPALTGSGGLHTLLLVNFLYALVALLVLGVALRVPSHSQVSAAPADAPPLGGMRAVWNDRLIRNLAGVSFLGFGVFVAVTTWLQALLSPDGISSDTAGILLVGMVVVGIVGSAAVPAVAARRGYTFRLLQATALGTCLACVLLAVVNWLPGFALAVAIIGFFLIMSLPLLLEVTERRAGRDGASATALMWMAGQGGGIVIAVIVQIVVHHPTVAFLLMAVAAVCALPLINGASRVQRQSSTTGSLIEPSRETAATATPSS